MTNFNITRTKKLKDNSKITEAVEHNFRLREQPNIDSTRTKMNQTLINSLDADLLNAGSFQKKLNDHYSKLGIKVRSDNVRCLEFMTTASPEFFDGRSQEFVQEWTKHQIDFFTKEFGENVKLAVLHLDEKTPHIHILVSTELFSTKRYKNQKGEFFKDVWSLNADRFNPEFLRGLHTRQAAHNQRYGLIRGVKQSGATHDTLKDFYRTVDEISKKDFTSEVEKFFNSPAAQNPNNVKKTMIELAKKLHVVKEYLIKFKNYPAKQKELATKQKELEKQAKRLSDREKYLKDQENLVRLSVKLQNDLIQEKAANSNLKKQLIHYQLKEMEEKKSKINETVQTKRNDFGKNAPKI
jgi:hypothetical protein